MTLLRHGIISIMLHIAFLSLSLANSLLIVTDKLFDEADDEHSQRKE